MTNWDVARIGDICVLEKGITGLAKAIPGPYPLVTTGPDRKTSINFQFDAEAVCIPLVSSAGHGKRSLNYVHYQSGKFALGTILVALIPKDKQKIMARYLHIYLQQNKDRILVPLMRGMANVTLAVKDITNLEIPLPALKKQNDIVNMMGRVEELRDHFVKQQQLVDMLMQAVLREAFPNGN